MKKILQKEKGITLIALIITIIVLLILAGITIGALTSDNSVMGQAQNARNSTEESKIKEVIKVSFSACVGNDEKFIVEEQELQDEIRKTYQDAEVSKDANKYIIVIKEKYYEIEDNGSNIEGPITFDITDKNPGDITKDKDGNPLDGTTKPYEIWNIEDLVKMSEMTINNFFSGGTNKKCVLMRDLDFNSIFSYNNYKAKYRLNDELNAYIPDESATTTIKELCTTGQGFIPIGATCDNNSTENTFRASFYAEEPHSIKNICINTSGPAGLFGGARGKISNITLDGNITCTGGNNAAGFVVGSYSVTIENCHNKAKIINEGSGITCGLFGIGSGIVARNSSNEGELISLNDSAYGISGTSGTIRNCKNTGNITGKASCAGISGAGWGNSGRTIINCGNEGEITSNTGNATGITCNGGASKIYNCYNTGRVNAGTIGQAGGGVHGLARNRKF